MLDAYKTTSTRFVVQIPEVLADIGGLFIALWLVFYQFGQFFSSKFFIASVASKLYIRKRPNHEMDKLIKS